jgi:uncharacterized protein (TIGR02996 family)
MSEEIVFIRAILAAPGDHTPRLVYADWLDERGESDAGFRAEYLRTECQLDSLPSKDSRRRRLQARLLELRKLVGDDWWQQLDWAKVEYCVEFEYACPQRWDTLSPTDDPAVRHCADCKRNVHYCRSSREAHWLADAGECVAIDTRLVMLPLGLVRQRREASRLLGKVAPRVPARIPLNMRGRQAESG